MLVSPLLSEQLVKQIAGLFDAHSHTSKIIEALKGHTVEEKIHVLRFLYPHIQQDRVPGMYAVWRSLLLQNHILNTSENRRALSEIGGWWDTFRMTKGMTTQRYDELECLLDTIGPTPLDRITFAGSHSLQ